MGIDETSLPEQQALDIWSEPTNMNTNNTDQNQEV
jgi:hypothetical protein